MRFLPTFAATLLLAAPLAAQQPAALVAAPSTRATTVLSVSPPRERGQPAPAAKTVTIDYGQPHARGRAVPTELATDGTIWRTGANSATTLTSQVDLTIGGAKVPAGAYSLYTIREGGKYVLIINKNTGQWGTEYDQARDHARVPLRMRTTPETTESLQIALVPQAEGPAKGVLTIAWGKLHLSADWSAP
ncbi:MAG: DUF2911 domain-containing protein [Gemmatimonadales bacterium]|nr:DUF2911 domain-containing protein [Gemmatimonadota bacterium]MCL4215246.1 DUF2911 domain-containing protein [Gemmatimonadales bacterium]